MVTIMVTITIMEAAPVFVRWIQARLRRINSALSHKPASSLPPLPSQLTQLKPLLTPSWSWHAIAVVVPTVILSRYHIQAAII